MDAATQVRRVLTTLFRELVSGPTDDWAFVLNPGDPGLLASLENVTAEEASRPGPRGASIAAHVDHLRYGLELLNRWHAGDPDPFSTADYQASWRRGVVTEADWRQRIAELRLQCASWGRALEDTRPLDDLALSGTVASVVHLAYHLGALRQMSTAMAGPMAKD